MFITSSSPVILFIFIHRFHNPSHLLYIQPHFIYIVILFTFIQFFICRNFIFTLNYLIFFYLHVVVLLLFSRILATSSIILFIFTFFFSDSNLILRYSSKSVQGKFMRSKLFSDQLFWIGLEFLNNLFWNFFDSLINFYFFFWALFSKYFFTYQLDFFLNINLEIGHLT